MKIRHDGCALCGSTWGNYWSEINGDKLFFCCNICAKSFTNMIKKIEEITDWPKVENLQIKGGVRGRKCIASFSDKALVFQISFTPDGDIRKFQTLE